MDAFVLLLVPVCIGAGLGMSWLLTRYTNIALFEPFIAVVLLVFFIFIFDFDEIATVYIAEMSVDADSGVMPVLTVFLALCLLTAIFSLLVLALVFAFYGICAIFSKRCKGRLVRFEIPEGKKAKIAFYRINGKEYQCVVASASKKLVVGNEYNVRLNRLQNKVYDKEALPVCFVGILTLFVMAGLFLLPYIVT